MAKINLLPWRENYITFQNRIFGSIAGVAVFCCGLLVFACSGYINHLAEQEVVNIKKVRVESSKLDRLITEIKGLQEQKSLLLKRRDVIQSLQASRPFIVKVFDGISSSVPNGLYLKGMNRVGDKLTLTGFSESNSRISSFMRKLESMDWLKEATLKEIKSEGNIVEQEDSDEFQEIEFTLKITLIYE